MRWNVLSHTTSYSTKRQASENNPVNSLCPSVVLCVSVVKENSPSQPKRAPRLSSNARCFLRWSVLPISVAVRRYRIMMLTLTLGVETVVVRTTVVPDQPVVVPRVGVHVVMPRVVQAGGVTVLKVVAGPR